MERDCKIGNDILISKLGFGTWPIGWKVNGDLRIQDSRQALECYFSNGGNFLDTALTYGESERIIGEFLEDSVFKKEAVIATKTPYGETMESIPMIVEGLEKSLVNLKRDYVDLYYFHVPSENSEVIEAGLEVMQKLKQQGKIRTIGASIKGPNVTEATATLIKSYIDTKQVDAIQLIYSIFRQKNSVIFDYATKKNVALIGRTSLESGFLTGRYRKGYFFPEDDHRSRWNKQLDEMIEIIEGLEDEYIGIFDDTLISLALRFALSPQAITNTIVGAKNREQMEKLIRIAEKPPINQNVLLELQQKYQDKNNLFNIQ